MPTLGPPTPPFPDPAEAPPARRGRLKIFFGSAPGVGKTRAMLSEAQDLANQGTDVVLGIVDTHDQPDVNALLAGLERLPARTFPRQGEFVEDLDLDGILARKPDLVLVDDLAHTNPPGARNRRRWQDVLDILDAGIHVYTAVSLQHLESLNDVVARITGLRVTETIPDTLLDRADEVELVDLPPEVLLERLEEGRIYVPEAARHAVERFFRKGNLMALREMALRFTAQRVDADMKRLQDGGGEPPVRGTGDTLLVAVDPSPLSARLIRSTCRLAAALKAPWMAVYVEPTGSLRYSEPRREQVEEHLRLAERLGGETVILPRSSSRISDDILTLARNRGVTKIVVGKPQSPRILDVLLGSTVDEIIRWSGDIDVHVITGDPEEGTRGPMTYVREPGRFVDYLWSTGAVAVATLLCLLLFRHPEHLASAVMIHLLAILMVGTRFGRWPSLLASTLSALSLAFFFIGPAFSFHLEGVGAMSTLAVLLGVGFAMGNLTERTRRQARLSREREQRILALFHLNRELVGELDLDRIAELASGQLKAAFRAESVFLLLRPDGVLAPVRPEPPLSVDGQDLEAARWAFEHQVPAGGGTDHFTERPGRFLPLEGTSGMVGVLALFPLDGAGLPRDQEHLLMLEQFCQQIASAFERVGLIHQRTETQRLMDREQVRAALLDSISEDLATPLQAIARSAAELREGDCDSAAARARLADIHREAERLHHLVRNLLDLARLESGGTPVERVRTGLGAAVLAAMDRLRAELEGRDIRVSVPDYLPSVSADPAMLEQILVNLLDNAARYSEAGTSIEVKAWSTGDSLAFAVSDEGPGIQPGDENRIFERLVRGSHATIRPGAGLGLAVVRAIVLAHGGSVQVHNQSTGGAKFLVTLPLEQSYTRHDAVDLQ